MLAAQGRLEVASLQPCLSKHYPSVRHSLPFQFRQHLVFCLGGHGEGQGEEDDGDDDCSHAKEAIITIVTYPVARMTPAMRA